MRPVTIIRAAGANGVRQDAVLRRLSAHGAMTAYHRPTSGGGFLSILVSYLGRASFGHSVASSQ